MNAQLHEVITFYLHFCFAVRTQDDDDDLYSDQRKRSEKAKSDKKWTTYRSDNSDNFEIHENSDESSPHKVDTRVAKDVKIPGVYYKHLGGKPSGQIALQELYEQEYLSYFSKDAKGNCPMSLLGLNFKA